MSQIFFCHKIDPSTTALFKFRHIVPHRKHTMQYMEGGGDMSDDEDTDGHGHDEPPAAADAVDTGSAETFISNLRSCGGLLSLPDDLLKIVGVFVSDHIGLVASPEGAQSSGDAQLLLNENEGLRRCFGSDNPSCRTTDGSAEQIYIHCKACRDVFETCFGAPEMVYEVLHDERHDAPGLATILQGVREIVSEAFRRANTASGLAGIHETVPRAFVVPFAIMASFQQSSDDGRLRAAVEAVISEDCSINHLQEIKKSLLSLSRIQSMLSVLSATGERLRLHEDPDERAVEYKQTKTFIATVNYVSNIMRTTLAKKLVGDFHVFETMEEMEQLDTLQMLMLPMHPEHSLKSNKPDEMYRLLLDHCCAAGMMRRTYDCPNKMQPEDFYLQKECKISKADFKPPTMADVIRAAANPDSGVPYSSELVTHHTLNIQNVGSLQDIFSRMFSSENNSGLFNENIVNKNATLDVRMGTILSKTVETRLRVVNDFRGWNFCDTVLAGVPAAYINKPAKNTPPGEKREFHHRRTNALFHTKTGNTGIRSFENVVMVISPPFRCDYMDTSAHPTSAEVVKQYDTMSLNGQTLHLEHPSNKGMVREWRDNVSLARFEAFVSIDGAPSYCVRHVALPFLTGRYTTINVAGYVARTIAAGAVASLVDRGRSERQCFCSRSNRPCDAHSHEQDQIFEALVRPPVAVDVDTLHHKHPESLDAMGLGTASASVLLHVLTATAATSERSGWLDEFLLDAVAKVAPFEWIDRGTRPNPCGFDNFHLAYVRLPGCDDALAAAVDLWWGAARAKWTAAVADHDNDNLSPLREMWETVEMALPTDFYTTDATRSMYAYMRGIHGTRMHRRIDDDEFRDMVVMSAVELALPQVALIDTIDRLEAACSARGLSIDPHAVKDALEATEGVPTSAGRFLLRWELCTVTGLEPGEGAHTLAVYESQQDGRTLRSVATGDLPDDPHGVELCANFAPDETLRGARATLLTNAGLVCTYYAEWFGRTAGAERTGYTSVVLEDLFQAPEVVVDGVRRYRVLFGSTCPGLLDGEKVSDALYRQNPSLDLTQQELSVVLAEEQKMFLLTGCRSWMYFRHQDRRIVRCREVDDTLVCSVVGERAIGQASPRERVISREDADPVELWEGTPPDDDDLRYFEYRYLLDTNATVQLVGESESDLMYSCFRIEPRRCVKCGKEYANFGTAGAEATLCKGCINGEQTFCCPKRIKLQSSRPVCGRATRSDSARNTNLRPHSKYPTRLFGSMLYSMNCVTLQHHGSESRGWVKSHVPKLSEVSGDPVKGLPANMVPMTSFCDKPVQDTNAGQRAPRGRRHNTRPSEKNEHLLNPLSGDNEHHANIFKDGFLFGETFMQQRVGMLPVFYRRDGDKQGWPSWESFHNDMYEQIMSVQAKSYTKEIPFVMADFLAFVGRLHFGCEIVDQWQQLLFIWGQACTGKSDIQKNLENCYPTHRRLVLGNTSERFGAGEIKDKMLIVQPEAPREKSEQMGIENIKKIVSGETINADRKGINPIDIYPDAQMLFSCNNTGQYNNSDQGWQRRPALVYFGQKVTQTDKQKCPHMHNLRDHVHGLPLLTTICAYHQAFFMMQGENPLIGGGVTLGCAKQSSAAVITKFFLHSRNVFAQTSAGDNWLTYLRQPVECCKDGWYRGVAEKWDRDAMELGIDDDTRVAALKRINCTFYNVVGVERRWEAVMRPFIDETVYLQEMIGSLPAAQNGFFDEPPWKADAYTAARDEELQANMKYMTSDIMATLVPKRDDCVVYLLWRTVMDAVGERTTHEEVFAHLIGYFQDSSDTNSYNASQIVDDRLQLYKRLAVVIEREKDNAFQGHQRARLEHIFNWLQVASGKMSYRFKPCHFPFSIKSPLFQYVYRLMSIMFMSHMDVRRFHEQIKDDEQYKKITLDNSELIGTALHTNIENNVSQGDVASLSDYQIRIDKDSARLGFFFSCFVWCDFSAEKMDVRAEDPGARY